MPWLSLYQDFMYWKWLRVSVMLDKHVNENMQLLTDLSIIYAGLGGMDEMRLKGSSASWLWLEKKARTSHMMMVPL